MGEMAKEGGGGVDRLRAPVGILKMEAAAPLLTFRPGA